MRPDAKKGAGFFFLSNLLRRFFSQGQKRLLNSQLTPLANEFDGSVKLGMKVEVSVK